MTSSVISFYTSFLNTNNSGTNADILFANSKQCFYSFMEFYVMYMYLKNVS